MQEKKKKWTTGIKAPDSKSTINTLNKQDITSSVFIIILKSQEIPLLLSSKKTEGKKKRGGGVRGELARLGI